jgi:hypothetical protein
LPRCCSEDTRLRTAVPLRTVDLGLAASVLRGSLRYTCRPSWRGVCHTFLRARG